MSIQEFLDKYNGQGIDYDGFYGCQCMDEFLQYNQDVVNAPRVYGNAVDVWTNYPTAFYDQIANTPDNFPQSGDVIIWGTGIGPYGHIAIVRDANVNTFTSLDQNWDNAQFCQFITHNYNAVLGWLRPKIFEPQPAPVEQPAPQTEPTPETVPSEQVVTPTQVTATTNTDSVTYNVETSDSPVALTGIPTPDSASQAISTQQADMASQSTPLTMPKKQPMRLSDLIVYLFMNIKRVLIKYLQ